MRMIRRAFILFPMFVLVLGVYAQAITEVSPIPAAFSEETPLPEAMQKKYAAYQKERRQKFYRAGENLPNVNSKLTRMLNSYTYEANGVLQIGYNMNRAAQHQILTPKICIRNTSYGHERIKGDGEHFNVKQDRLSSAIVMDQCICLVNRKGKLCDMSEFNFATSSEMIKMTGNRIVCLHDAYTLMNPAMPKIHQVTMTHIKSGARYTFDLYFELSDVISYPEDDYMMSVCLYDPDTTHKTGVLFDYNANSARLIRLPLTLDAEGRDGANGRRGANGLNGANEFTWTDKEGKTHTRKGTCASAGSDGEDGRDGTNGGRVLLFLSPELLNVYSVDAVQVEIEAGKGGVGGKGGKGGIHGKGSGCSGKAADGRDGRDGADGARGDFLYVEADVVGFMNKFYGWQ